MTVEQEEKIFKSIGLFTLLVFVPLNTFVIKDPMVKLVLIVPLLLVFSILYWRRYQRDKKAGNDLSRYKRLMVYIGISLLIFTAFLLFTPN